MRVFIHMATVALVLGTAMSVAATGRLTVSLVVSGFICWSFVPVLQLLTGLWMVRGARRSVALEGYFATHRPWSLWILSAAAVLLLVGNPGGAIFYVLISAVVPAALTVRALTRFSRETLGDTPRGARRRVAGQQAVTFVLILIYVDLSVALWPRIAGALG